MYIYRYIVELLEQFFANADRRIAKIMRLVVKYQSTIDIDQSFCQLGLLILQEAEDNTAQSFENFFALLTLLIAATRPRTL
jgi:hypothetical protein